MKCIYGCKLIEGEKSPPSRGAWIEMMVGQNRADKLERRPPRGGRGLKLAYGQV